MLRNARDAFRRWTIYMRYSGGWKIARRYFVIDAFQTTLTVISLMVSSYVFGVREPRTLIGFLINVAIATMLAGISIVMLVETVEKGRELEELERALLRDLNNTILERAAMAAIVTAVIMELLGILLPISIPVLMIVAFSNSMLSDQLILTIIAIELVLLFLVGLFLGSRPIWRMVLIGVVSVLLGVALALIGVTLNAAL